VLRSRMQRVEHVDIGELETLEPAPDGGGTG
jgi:hypothetical protein